MKRFILVTAGSAAVATLGLGLGLAAAATAAEVSGSANAQVALESKVERQIHVVDTALARIDRSSATHRLDAEVRSEVRASIDADQSALSRLHADVNTATTLAEVREVRDEVSSYQVAVYAQAIATLNRAEALQERVDDARPTVTLDLSASGLLDRAETALSATVEGAVALDATSNAGEVRAVKADLRAAASAYAKATS